MAIILITGAAGRICTMLRSRLARSDRTLRLLDTAPLTAGASEEVVHASITDMAAMTRACRDVEAVIHLAALCTETSWEQILHTNIHGTYTVFEAARAAGVSRIVYASSNHVTGFYPAARFPVPDYAYPAPDTLYGVSKATGEALAALYHHRYKMDMICLRLLSCRIKPEDPRQLSTWLSPDDAGRLFEACLTTPRPGFRVAHAVSANTRGGWVSLNEAHALGYEPSDDAERYAEPDPASPTMTHLGGSFCSPSRKPLAAEQASFAGTPARCGGRCAATPFCCKEGSAGAGGDEEG
jgi:uronate dehydrogenase